MRTRHTLPVFLSDNEHPHRGPARLRERGIVEQLPGRDLGDVIYDPRDDGDGRGAALLADILERAFAT